MSSFSFGENGGKTKTAVVTNRKLTLKVTPLFVCFFAITQAKTFGALLEGRIMLQHHKCELHPNLRKKDLFLKELFVFWDVATMNVFLLDVHFRKVGTIFFIFTR